MRDVIGNILQDEKIPGVHIAFGNPYGAHTGADWYSSTHIDVVGRQFDIWIDERQIMRGGAFLIDTLASEKVQSRLDAAGNTGASSNASNSAAAWPRSSATAKLPAFFPRR